MALVHHLQHIPLQVDAKHSEARATYSLVKDGVGGVCLQLDTYGSPDRQLKGKKSQSIRLSPAAIAELKIILAQYF